MGWKPMPREKCDLDSLANAKQVKAPAVFVLADSDTTVPPKYQKKIVDVYAGPRQTVTLQHADHNSIVEGRGLDELRTQLNWLWAQHSAAK
jgi:pimeloyl-ACP methyl ester carboxylesterase